MKEALVCSLGNEVFEEVDELKPWTGCKSGSQPQERSVAQTLLGLGCTWKAVSHNEH